MRFLQRATLQLAPHNGRHWSGGRDMKRSQAYTRTFGRAASCCGLDGFYTVILSSGQACVSSFHHTSVIASMLFC